jgi:DNA-binding CsgD family transcriptional regulator
MSSYRKPNISKVRLFGVQSLLTSLLASTLLFLKAMTTGVVTIELFRPIIYGLLYFILFKIVHDMKSNQEEDVDKFCEYQLTKREMMLAELVIAGKSNRQIAGTLFIAESTVKKHIQNIYRKTQTTDRQSFIDLMK